MAEPKSKEKEDRDYVPDAQLVGHMRRRLQLIRSLQRLGAGEEFPKDLEKKQAALSTDKTRILHKIFHAMADITFFFGVMNTHPEIQKVFENDIKEILGVKRRDPKNTPYAFMFNILVSGMLLAQYPTGKDFRLRLNEQLQHLVWNKMTLYLADIFESIAGQNMITQDFNRVFGWAEMLMFAMEKRDEYRIPDVVPVSGHGKRPTRLEKQLIDEGEKSYLEDIKRNSPRRTFNLKDVSDILPIN